MTLFVHGHRLPLRQQIESTANAAEELRLLTRILWAGPRRPARFRSAAANGIRVLLLPGLLADDASMRPLRFSLGRAGYRAYRWGLGRNRGATADLFERLDRRIDQLQADDDAPIILVGWSFGGLIAREYAKIAPHRVRAVITLGSPFAGDLSGTLLSRFYAWASGHRVEAAPLSCTLAVKPPVPTIALWSSRDGLLPAFATHGGADGADRYVEVSCAHLAFPFDPRVAAAVIAAIGDYCPVEQSAQRGVPAPVALGAPVAQRRGQVSATSAMPMIEISRP